jgi:hypothetical protein
MIHVLDKQMVYLCDVTGMLPRSVRHANCGRQKATVTASC